VDSRNVSIVIPTYQRPAQLAACLEAIAQVDRAGAELEMIVVDDGSAPPVRVQEGVRLIRQANAGPAAARNRGAAEATGAMLVFLDDDCRPRRDWLRELLAAWVPGRLVGGACRNAITGNVFAAFNERLTDAVVEWFAAARHPLQFLTSSNLLMETEAFRRIGGFSEDFPLAAGEDREFSARWRDAGGELVTAPKAVVDHHHAQTFRKFVSMHLRYGRGAACFHKVRGTMARPIETRGLYAHLFRRCRPLALLPVSQAATALGYWLETRKSARSSGIT
jgi:GT2 family glycosyltransferase